MGKEEDALSAGKDGIFLELAMGRIYVIDSLRGL